MCALLVDIISYLKLRRIVAHHRHVAQLLSGVRKLKMQTRQRCCNDDSFSCFFSCYRSKFRSLVTILHVESEYEVSFDVCRVPGELYKLQKYVQLKNRFLPNILRFRCRTSFLTADSESTQNFGSYRTFLCTRTCF